MDRVSRGRHRVRAAAGAALACVVAAGLGSAGAAAHPARSATCEGLPRLYQMTVVRDRLYHVRCEDRGNELWTSDGTPEGTVPLRTFGRSAPRSLTAVGGRLFFETATGPEAQRLWTSDGTRAGTRVLHVLVRARDRCPPYGGRCDAYLATEFGAFGDRLLFGVLDGIDVRKRESRSSLWITDGTQAGTVRLGAIFAGLWRVPTAGGRAFFEGSDGAHQGLWATDGTPGGTVFLRDIVPPDDPDAEDSSDIEDEVTLGDRLVLAVTRWAHDTTLWIGDGTPSGTVPFAEVPASEDSVSYLVVGDRLVFWRTDPGTLEPTLHSVDATGVVATLRDGWADAVMIIGRGLLFFADGSPTARLWITDGTPEGTVPIPTFPTSLSGAAPRSLGVLGDRAMLVGADAEHGSEPWTTDGTDAGTALVADIRPGPEGSCISAGDLVAGPGDAAGPSTVAGDSPPVWFIADDGTHGREPWVSDGTTAGTHLVRDINPGPASSSPSGLLGSHRAYFAADDGTHGFELWTSDGTEAGTVLLSDQLPGPRGVRPAQHPQACPPRAR